MYFRKYAPASLLMCLTFAATPAKSDPIPQRIVEGLLDQGGWSISSDDINSGERLSLDWISQLIGTYPKDTRTIGLLTLTLSAGKWGVSSLSKLPADPAAAGWRGPTRASGKHLMSYKIGGVGLPHLDVEHLADLVDFLLAKHPTIGDLSEQKYMQGLAYDLRHGKKYDQVKANHIFQKWMLHGLRQHDAQVWILESWLDDYWTPAYRASHGDVRLAFVLARIWNTSPGLGKCAASRALASADPIQAALEAYVRCPGGSKRYKKARWGWMERPIAVYDHAAGKQESGKP